MGEAILFCLSPSRDLASLGTRLPIHMLVYVFRTDCQSGRLCNRTPVIQSDSQLHNRASG